MDKVYSQAKDVHVRYYRLYSKANDTYVYVDSACKTKAKTSEIKDAVLKGALVDIAGKLYSVTCYEEATNVGQVTILTAGASSAATLTVLKGVAD